MTEKQILLFIINERIFRSGGITKEEKQKIDMEIRNGNFLD